MIQEMSMLDVDTAKRPVVKVPGSKDACVGRRRHRRRHQEGLLAGEVKEHDVAKGVVVRTAKAVRRPDGSYIARRNALVVIDKDNPAVLASSAPSLESCAIATS